MYVGQEKMKLFYVRQDAGSDLIRVKRYVIGHHLMDDTNQLSSAVPKGCIVIATFGAFICVKLFESGVVFNGVMRRVYQGVPQGS